MRETKRRYVVGIIVTLFVTLLPVWPQEVYAKIDQNVIMELIAEQNMSIQTVEGAQELTDYFINDSAWGDGKTFPYTNAGKYVSGNISDGVYTRKVASSKGCYLYAQYVEKVFFDSKKSSRLYADGEKKVTEAGIRNLLQTYGQAGEHLRVDGTHSMVFLAAGDNGFYYLHYSGDSSKKIRLAYLKYADFAKKYKNYKVWLYDVDNSENDKGAETDIETVYSITYKLDGGTNSSENPSSYKSSSDTINLKNPKKDGYKFVGWYSDSSYKTKVTQIKAGSAGNKTYYAKWEKNPASSETYQNLSDDVDAWMTWAQGDSGNANMRKSGCRVTAFSMMFAEAGYAVDYNNPTEFYNILCDIKAINSGCLEQGTYGSIAVNYAKHLGGTAKVTSRYNGSEKGILNLLKNSKNYYIVLQANNSSKTHTMYVMRNKSLEDGKVWLMDPASGTYFEYGKLSEKYSGRTITYRGVCFSNMPEAE